VDQIAIALTGATAIWLSQDERVEWRKWACIFALSFLYTFAWMRSIRYHWLSHKTVLDGK
jgi:hypothetical protein